MTGWNYPPGVSGNEPFLTGEPDFDPHAPFWAAPDPEHSGYPEGMEWWAVYFGPDYEDHYFWGYTEDDAKNIANHLNEHYSLKDEQRAKDGHCRVCGDYHGDPEELYEV